MKSFLPPLRDVVSSLSQLKLDEMVALATKTGVPLPTLRKIRYSVTENPGYETMGKILPHLRKAKSAPNRASSKVEAVAHE